MLNDFTLSLFSINKNVVSMVYRQSHLRGMSPTEEFYHVSRKKIVKDLTIAHHIFVCYDIMNSRRHLVRENLCR